MWYGHFMIRLFQDFGTPQHLSGVILMSTMNTSCCGWLSSDDIMSWQHGRQRCINMFPPSVSFSSTHVNILVSSSYQIQSFRVAVDIIWECCCILLRFPLPSYQLDKNPSPPPPLSNTSPLLWFTFTLWQLHFTLWQLHHLSNQFTNRKQVHPEFHLHCISPTQ